MSKVIRTQKPSVLPWYAAALVFAVLCAALPVYKLWALLIALGGAAVMFGVAIKPSIHPWKVLSLPKMHTRLENAYWEMILLAASL